MLFGFLKKKGKYPTTERRREPRYGAEDEFLIDLREKKSDYLGSSRDISVHGVRFATTCQPHKKQALVLKFRMPQTFPGEKHFSVKARVVRIYKPRGTARYRVGCSLQHEDETTKETLRQVIYWLEHR